MIARLVTDFPEPDSPTNPNTSPSAIEKLTSRTASAPPNATLSPRTSNNFSATPLSYQLVILTLSGIEGEGSLWLCKLHARTLSETLLPFV